MKEKGTPVSYKVNVVIETDEEGYYAYAPELEGCHTQGTTLEEVMANIREAVELYLRRWMLRNASGVSARRSSQRLSR